LDVEQPVFVLASVHLTDDVAKRLLQLDSKEFKFSRLKDSAHGRKYIIDILNSPDLKPGQVLISGFHKPFMIITKMIDLLLEPLMYATGFDLYEKGANLGLANMWYYVMPLFIGKKRFESLKVAFVNMVRTPDIKKVNQFYEIVNDAIVHVNESKFADDLAMLLATQQVAESELNEWDSSNLDPAIPAFSEHASIWTGKFDSEFVIIHDDSKPLAQQQIIIEATMSTKEEIINIGYDRRKMAFPIRANGIRFQNSSTCPQIQVADIIAGATAYSLCKTIHKEYDKFAEEILLTKSLKDCHYCSLWPEQKFTPEELGTNEVGGIDANNYVGAYISRRLGGIPPKGKREKQ